MKTWFVTGMLVLASVGAGNAQDVAAGEKSFAKCAPCHAIGPNPGVRLGPPLNGLEGRRAGSHETFKYSDANKNSGVVWNHDTFVKYINNPAEAMPGNRMPFPGIKDPAEAENLWAFLKQFKADGSK
jgi:cytochrome c